MSDLTRYIIFVLLLFQSQCSLAFTSAPSQEGLCDEVLSEANELFMLQMRSTEKRADFSEVDGGDNLLRLIPEKNIIMCACAKCGSTSMFKFVYQGLTGTPWIYAWDPYIQYVSGRWEGKMQNIAATTALNMMHNSGTLSVALLRDPRERLVSAWKSKLACNGKCWRTDYGDKQRNIDDLARLAGGQPGKECLTFKEFVDWLFTIHNLGRALELEDHFLPQQFGCFKSIPIQQWSVATTVSDPKAAEKLGERLGIMNASFPEDHKSHEDCIEQLTEQDIADKLDEITAMEYHALGMNAETNSGLPWLQRALGNKVKS